MQQRVGNRVYIYGIALFLMDQCNSDEAHVCKKRISLWYLKIMNNNISLLGAFIYVQIGNMTISYLATWYWGWSHCFLMIYQGIRILNSGKMPSKLFDLDQTIAFSLILFFIPCRDLINQKNWPWVLLLLELTVWYYLEFILCLCEIPKYNYASLPSTACSLHCSSIKYLLFLNSVTFRTLQENTFSWKEKERKWTVSSIKLFVLQL